VSGWSLGRNEEDEARNGNISDPPMIEQPSYVAGDPRKTIVRPAR